jgi:hypothetical protein
MFHLALAWLCLMLCPNIGCHLSALTRTLHCADVGGGGLVDHYQLDLNRTVLVADSHLY